MEIRACTDLDLAALTSRWPVPGGVHEAHLARARAGRAPYLVAWEDDEPLGAAVLRRDGVIGDDARAAFPEAAGLCHLQVRPEHRGSGVGTALVAAAEQEARRRGHPTVAMGVGEDNLDAQRLYARLGYRATGVRDVIEYDWMGPDGAVHHAQEHDQLLVKHLL